MLKNLIEGNSRSREFAIRDINDRKVSMSVFASALAQNDEGKVQRSYKISGTPEISDFKEFSDKIIEDARMQLDKSNSDFVEEAQRTERKFIILRKRLEDKYAEKYTKAEMEKMVEVSQPDGSVPEEYFKATGDAAPAAAPADDPASATGDAAPAAAPVCSGFVIRAMKGTAFLSEAQVSRINENIELYDMGLPVGFRVVIATGDKIVGPVTNKSIIAENIGEAIAKAMMPAKKATATKKAAATKKASSSSKASEPKKTKK